MNFRFSKQAEHASDFEKLILARARAGENRQQIPVFMKVAGAGEMGELAARAPDDRELFFAMRDPQRRAHVDMARKTIAAGTTADSTWAAPLAALAQLQGAWFESLRNYSLLDALVAQGMVYAPVGRKFPITAAVGTGYSVTEAAWKPLTKFSFDGATTESLKAMGMVVVSNDLLKMGDAVAEGAIMAQLRNVVAVAADEGVLAVLLDGITPIASTGSPRQDLREAFAAVPLGQASRPIIVCAPALAKQMALEGDTYGAPAFPDMQIAGGGSIAGVPVLACDALASYSTYGDMLVVVDATQLAGSAGGVDVTVAAGASIQMVDNPSGAANLVSMFQTNSSAIRAERWYNVERVRSTAVAAIKLAHYTSGSSP